MHNVKEQSYYEKIRLFETELICEALGRARGNQAQAARMLGLSPTTLSSQLRRLGIQAKRFKAPHSLRSVGIIPMGSEAKIEARRSRMVPD